VEKGEEKVGGEAEANPGLPLRQVIEEGEGHKKNNNKK
jgi:hypothetical protein